MDVLWLRVIIILYILGKRMKIPLTVVNTIMYIEPYITGYNDIEQV